MELFVTKNFIFWLYVSLGTHFVPLNNYELVDIGQINSTIVFDADLIKTKFDRLITRKVAKKLDLVQKELESLGFGLKIKSAFKFETEDTHLINLKGEAEGDYALKCLEFDIKSKNYNRGSVVDAVLIYLDNQAEVKMPTTLTDCDNIENIDFSKIDPQIKTNHDLLINTMKKHGLIQIDKRWWHFLDETWDGFPLYFNTTDLEEALNPTVGATPKNLCYPPSGINPMQGMICEADEYIKETYPKAPDTSGNPTGIAPHCDYMLNFANFLK